MLLGAGVPVAESVLRPMLIDPANLEETIQRIGANRGLFVASIFAYVTAFVADVLVAWGLYALLAPVGRALSMLTSWFRLFYAAIALGGHRRARTASSSRLSVSGMARAIRCG